MDRIWIEIGEQYQDSAYRRMVERLRAEGIQVCRMRREEREAHSLLLTDSQELADWAAGRNLACAGYEPPDTEIRLTRVDMVVQSLEELDGAFFDLIYRRYHGSPWTIARTERLVIRESVPEDFDALYDMYGEPGAADYMPGMERGKEEERELFTAYIRRVYPFYSYGLWTVLEKSSGRLVGRAGVENGTYQNSPVLEIGYLIGRDYQRQGYGLEAVAAIKEYAFTALGAEELYAFIHRDNTASRRLARRAGFLPVEEAGEIEVLSCTASGGVV